MTNVPSILAALDAAAARPLNAAVSLPPRAYSDPEFLSIELQEIFGREWLCIGRESDMPASGDYLTFDLPDLKVMAVRQKDGGIRTMSRVCRHRAALLGVSPGGAGNLFVCPYHKWTYELDGTLRGAPTMGGNLGFEASDCALPTFRTETWEGFVFVNADPDAEPLAPRLGPLVERLAPYRLREMKTAFRSRHTWACNWKVAFENGIETYHHWGVHAKTLEPAFPTLGTICEPGGTGFNLHSVPAAPDFSFTEPAGRATDWNPDLTNRQLGKLIIVGIYPSLILALSGPNVTWFSFNPAGVSTTDARANWLAPPAYFDAPDYAHLLEHDQRTLGRIVEEDAASCAGVQGGLSARDAVAGALSPLERPVAEFVRYLANRLCEPRLPRREGNR